MALVLLSCDKGNSPETNGESEVEVRMTDAPGPFDAVLVDIQGVEIHSDVNGWNTVALANPGVYDLLKLTNGLDTLLGTATLPSGQISQLRLKLGSRNSVVLNGNSYDLATPSAQQSGLKVQIHQNLSPGIRYTILLDFDASMSIVETGNDAYILKPVIRAITQGIDGALQGKISPSVIARVQAISTMGDTTGTYSDSTGSFIVQGLQSGTYQVDILPPAPYQDTTFTGVVVVNGQITQMGTLNIQ